MTCVFIYFLDPANDALPYEAAIDITELVTLDDTMSTYNLGPNGGLMYCMEFVEKNIDWLLEKISKLKDHYFLFDFPGQVNLADFSESLIMLLILNRLNFTLIIHLQKIFFQT